MHLSLALLTAVAFGPQAPTDSDYFVTDLGAVTAYEISGNGTVCGGGILGPFVWTPTTPNGSTGSFRYLVVPKGYEGATAYSVNNSGVSAGRTYSGKKLPQALIWASSGTVSTIGSGTRTQTESVDVNGFEDTLVWAPSAGFDQSVVLSKIVNGSRRTYTIGSGHPLTINDQGQILVQWEGNGNLGQPSYIWTPTSPRGTHGTTFRFPEGSRGLDMNEKGQAACYQSEWDSEVNRAVPRPAIYLPSSDYGLSPGFHSIYPDIIEGLTPPAGGRWWDGAAVALNDAGTVIGRIRAYVGTVDAGTTCWVWNRSTGAREILVPGWRVYDVIDINDAGQMLIIGIPDGSNQKHSLLVTPA